MQRRANCPAAIYAAHCVAQVANSIRAPTIAWVMPNAGHNHLRNKILDRQHPDRWTEQGVAVCKNLYDAGSWHTTHIVTGLDIVYGRCYMHTEKPKLIIINGPVGIGKSTIANRYVADHLFAFHINGDEIIANIGGWLDHESEARRMAFEIVKAMARAHLVAGHDVVVPHLLSHP